MLFPVTAEMPPAGTSGEEQPDLNELLVSLEASDAELRAIYVRLSSDPGFAPN